MSDMIHRKDKDNNISLNKWWMNLIWQETNMNNLCENNILTTRYFIKNWNNFEKLFLQKIFVIFHTLL